MANWFRRWAFRQCCTSVSQAVRREGFRLSQVRNPALVSFVSFVLQYLVNPWIFCGARE